MERKQDHRTKYTEMIIRESYLQLTEKKPLAKISVKELCERANISRGTFYTHYDDLSALLERLEEEMAEELIQVVSKMYEGENYLLEVFGGVFTYLKQNKSLSAILLDRTSTGKGLEKLQKFAMNKTVDNWVKNSSLTLHQAERIYIYISSGCYAVYREWYNNGFSDDLEDIEMTLAGVITKGLYGFVYAK